MPAGKPLPKPAAKAASVSVVNADPVVAEVTVQFKQILDQFKQHGTLDWPKAESIVSKLQRLIPTEPDPIPCMRARGGYDEAHGLNVAVYAMSVGRGLKLTATRLRELGLAGLFHDLGKIIPMTHPRKPELLKFQEHGSVGRMVLCENFEVPPHIGEWVQHHHERINGSGPLGVTKVSLEAQVIGLCDLYDANLTPHPRRNTLTPHASRSVTLHTAEGRFSPQVIRAFEEQVLPYPPGMVVLLTGGDRARVLKPSSSENPLVPVIQAGDGQVHDLSQYAAPRVVDLARA